MSNRFRPAWLLVLAALSASALAKAPETVNIGYQKANIFALLKYRGTLDESLKKQGIAVRWVEFPAGPQMLEGSTSAVSIWPPPAMRRRPLPRRRKPIWSTLPTPPLTQKRKRLWSRSSRRSAA